MRTCKHLTSRPAQNRGHGLRCAFRKVANVGLMRLADYPLFVSQVDRMGLDEAMRRIAGTGNGA